MTDFDVIREWLMDEWTTWERENRTPENNQALAALSRVEKVYLQAVEERDEALAAQKQTILEDGKVVSRVVAENKLLREALERIAEMYDGDIEVDGTESDAWVFARADDFVTAHGIARAALAAPTKEGT